MLVPLIKFIVLFCNVYPLYASLIFPSRSESFFLFYFSLTDRFALRCSLGFDGAPRSIHFVQSFYQSLSCLGEKKKLSFNSCVKNTTSFELWKGKKQFFNSSMVTCNLYIAFLYREHLWS